MGLDAYAEAEWDENQCDLEGDLKTLGLDENLRLCEINVWKSVFKYCTCEGTHAYLWTSVPKQKVRDWANTARETADNVHPEFIIESSTKRFGKNNDATAADVLKMCTYLQTCAKYNASIRFC